jgi:hypothetical protein
LALLVALPWLQGVSTKLIIGIYNLLHPFGTQVQVGHRCFDVAVPKKLLDGV